MSFKKIVIWNEFPEEINWEEVKKNITFKTDIYVAVRTKKEYQNIKKKAQNKNITICAWPTIPRAKGYWFSGYTDKKEIKKLESFKGTKLKIDIEPPLPKTNFNPIKLFLGYIIPYFLIKKGKNNQYLKETIQKVSKNTEMIISGFPFPEFILKRYGDDIEIKENMHKNYILYSTIFGKLVMHTYLKQFAKNKIKKYGNKAMFGIGCIGPGILKDEPTYMKEKQLEQDLKMLQDIGAENIAIFNLKGIMKRKKLIRTIKKFTS